MDAATATALGALLVGLGGVATAVVTFLGKRGENALTGYNSLTDQLQEELATKKVELTEKKVELTEKSAALAVEAAERARAEAENARLRGIITQLGGSP
ncbi:hypothetical protein [Streptomyces cucumeris]|uniref:hypothetical protein n=1 Tax=Streptomyces cucumeris TaxID=2962890 RepID=UPI003D75AADE